MLAGVRRHAVRHVRQLSHKHLAEPAAASSASTRDGSSTFLVVAGLGVAAAAATYAFEFSSTRRTAKTSSETTLTNWCVGCRRLPRRPSPLLTPRRAQEQHSRSDNGKLPPAGERGGAGEVGGRRPRVARQAAARWLWPVAQRPRFLRRGNGEPRAVRQGACGAIRPRDDDEGGARLARRLSLAPQLPHLDADAGRGYIAHRCCMWTPCEAALRCRLARGLRLRWRHCGSMGGRSRTFRPSRSSRWAAGRRLAATARALGCRRWRRRWCL